MMRLDRFEKIEYVIGFAARCQRDAVRLSNRILELNDMDPLNEEEEAFVIKEKLNHIKYALKYANNLRMVQIPESPKENLIRLA